MPKAPSDTPPLSPLVLSIFDGFLQELEEKKVLAPDALARLKKAMKEEQESAHAPLREAIFGADGAGK